MVEEAHEVSDVVPLTDMAEDGVEKAVPVKLDVEVTLYTDVRVGTGLAQGEGLVEAQPDKEGLVVAVLEKGMVPEDEALGQADSVLVGFLETLETREALGKPDKVNAGEGELCRLKEGSDLKSNVAVVEADTVTHAEALEEVVDDTVLVATGGTLEDPDGVTVLLGLCVIVTVVAAVPVIVGVEVLQAVNVSDIMAVAEPTPEGELVAVARRENEVVGLLEKEAVVVIDGVELGLTLAIADADSEMVTVLEGLAESAAEGLFETLGLLVCELVAVPHMVTLLLAVRVEADDEELEGEGLSVANAVCVEQLDGEVVGEVFGEAVVLGDPLLQRLDVAVAEVDPELLVLCDRTAEALEQALAVLLAVDELERTGVNEETGEGVALADPVNEALKVALAEAHAEPVPLPLRVTVVVAVLEKQDVAEKCDAVPVWHPVTVPETLGEAEVEGLREVAAVVLAETVPLRLLLLVGVAVLDTHGLVSGEGDTVPLVLALGLTDVSELVG